MSPFEEVLRRWDVLRFLRRQGYEVKLTETGEARINCPRCRDHKYRLYINRRTKSWLCFNCPPGRGRGRSALSYVQHVLNCDDDVAMRNIVQTAGGIALDFEDAEPRPKQKTLDKEFALPSEFRPLVLPATERSQPYWDYLVSRNITASMVRHYGMGYCRVGDYKGRVIIPINIFGVRRGWVGRHIGNAKLKYINPDGLQMAHLLFNLDNVISSGSEKVVLMEGVFDVFRMNDIAVCTFGKKISNHQIRLLVEAGFKQWVFCYDGDAWADAEHYASQVPSYVECFRAKLPREYDPGKAPPLVLSQAIRDAEYWNLASVGV